MFPRESGNQWNVPKAHEQKHIAPNIGLWGAPQNIYTGPQEHNHIENTKNLLKRTQKRQSLFDEQLGNRLVDRYIIDHTWNKCMYYQSLLKRENNGEKKKLMMQFLNALKWHLNLKLLLSTTSSPVIFKYVLSG